MNKEILVYALSAIGRLEVLLQGGETAYNQLLQEHQRIVAENEALKKELETLKGGK